MGNPLFCLPGNITVTENSSSMIITRKWSSYLPLLFTGPFIAFFIGILIFKFKASDLQKPGMVFFLLIFAIITYACIAQVVNKTKILISKKLISVKHFPFPWWGNKNIDALQIKQLYVKENIDKISRGGPFYEYVVNITTTGGDDVVLLRSISSSEHASIIKKRIEEYLGIKDSPVKGEYNPNS